MTLPKREVRHTAESAHPEGTLRPVVVSRFGFYVSTL